MKTKKSCPKCESTDIIRIPGTIEPFGLGNNIKAGATILSSVKVTRFLCAGCGFSEEWADDLDGISRLKKKYQDS